MLLIILNSCTFNYLNLKHFTRFLCRIQVVFTFLLDRFPALLCLQCVTLFLALLIKIILLIVIAICDEWFHLAGHLLNKSEQP